MAMVSTIIAGIGLALGAVGLGFQFFNAKKQAKASEKAEKLREQQMKLDAMRRRREIIRQMILTNSQAKSNAATQGVSQSDSAVQGAIGQQVNTAAQNITSVNQGEAIGQGIFQANAQYAQAGVGMAWGQSFSNVGSGLVENSQMISRVGSSAGLWKPDVA